MRLTTLLGKTPPLGLNYPKEAEEPRSKLMRNRLPGRPCRPKAGRKEIVDGEEGGQARAGTEMVTKSN